MQYQGLRIHNMKQTLKNQTKHITTLSQKHPFSFGDHKKSPKIYGLGGHQNGFFFF